MIHSQDFTVKKSEEKKYFHRELVQIVINWIIMHTLSSPVVGRSGQKGHPVYFFKKILFYS